MWKNREGVLAFGCQEIKILFSILDGFLLFAGLLSHPGMGTLNYFAVFATMKSGASKRMFIATVRPTRATSYSARAGAEFFDLCVPNQFGATSYSALVRKLCWRRRPWACSRVCGPLGAPLGQQHSCFEGDAFRQMPP